MGLIAGVDDTGDDDVVADEIIEEVAVGGLDPRDWQVAPRSVTSLNVSKAAPLITPYLVPVADPIV
jgi:hypothetical protein